MSRLGGGGEIYENLSIYSERLLDATVISNIFSLRIDAIYLHSNLVHGIASVLIYEEKRNEKKIIIMKPKTIDTVNLDSHRSDIVLAGENHR